MNTPINQKKNAFIFLVDRDGKNKEKYTCSSIDIWLNLDDSVRNPIQRDSYLSKWNHLLCLLNAEGTLISLTYKGNRPWCLYMYIYIHIHREYWHFHILLSDKKSGNILKTLGRLLNLYSSSLSYLKYFKYFKIKLIPALVGWKLFYPQGTKIIPLWTVGEVF